MRKVFKFKLFVYGFMYLFLLIMGYELLYKTKRHTAKMVESHVGDFIVSLGYVMVYI